MLQTRNFSIHLNNLDTWFICVAKHNKDDSSGEIRIRTLIIFLVLILNQSYHIPRFLSSKMIFPLLSYILVFVYLFHRSYKVIWNSSKVLRYQKMKINEHKFLFHFISFLSPNRYGGSSILTL